MVRSAAVRHGLSAMSGKRVNRRQFVGKSVAAAGSAALCCAPAIAQGGAHVVVIGGGFGGLPVPASSGGLIEKYR